eukprot:GHVR01073301.1.p1 GENE.GHVR01073301.1~~GHVR01073301.1.p1  ORF type:complete len:110 (+),score=0.82 GHVR01073301.1:282-611(+)
MIAINYILNSFHNLAIVLVLAPSDQGINIILTKCEDSDQPKDIFYTKLKELKEDQTEQTVIIKLITHLFERGEKIFCFSNSVPELKKGSKILSNLGKVFLKNTIKRNYP